MGAHQTLEGDLLLWYARGTKSLDYVALNTPCHRADKTLRRRRRVGRGNLQYLCDQRRVARNPVSHYDLATRARYTHHLFSDVKWLWRKHGAENAYHTIECLVLEIIQV